MINFLNVLYTKFLCLMVKDLTREAFLGKYRHVDVINNEVN